MDLNIFIVFVALALILTILAYFIRGNLGLSLAFLSAGIMFLLGILIGTGEPITSTIYFDSTTFTDHIYNLGISATNIMIFFFLFGILNIMTAVADWLG